MVRFLYLLSVDAKSREKTGGFVTCTVVKMI